MSAQIKILPPPDFVVAVKVKCHDCEYRTHTYVGGTELLFGCSCRQKTEVECIRKVEGNKWLADLRKQLKEA